MSLVHEQARDRWFGAWKYARDALRLYSAFRIDCRQTLNSLLFELPPHDIYLPRINLRFLASAV
jgi:hypothetical protein